MKQQSFATAEKPLFRKSNIADKEVPVMLTQRTGYELDSDGAAYICRFLKLFFSRQQKLRTIYEQ